MNNIGNKIVKQAQQFLGVKEKKGNSGFDSEEVLELMVAAGWKKGEAWCMYAVEIVYRLVYARENSYIERDFDYLLSSSATQTLQNVKRSTKYRDLISDKPVVGAIAIWQNYVNGKPSWTGHGAIVESFTETEVSTIDGNTNAAGSREGDRWARKTRPLLFEGVNGLVLKGFIHPPQP